MKTGKPEPRRSEDQSPDMKQRKAEIDALNLRREILKGFGIEDTMATPKNGTGSARSAGGFNMKGKLGG